MASSYEMLADGFSDPAAAYRPMIFWVWNGDMTREGIAEDIQDFFAKGLGGFFIHPMGENFRLGDFIKGINPPYLSDEYLALVRYAVETAQAAGLYAWLYDEGGWPSGTAQGAVLADHPELQARTLTMQCVDISALNHRPATPDGCVVALAFTGDGLPQVWDFREPLATPPHGTTLVAFFVERPVEGRTDLMNPDAVKRFIDVTHERYAQVVGEFFGNVVPGMFTDEPSIPGRIGSDAIQYTPGILEAFQAARSFDVRPYLPVLFNSECGAPQLLPHYTETDIAAIRCEYSDLWTDLYQQAYWEQINAWCAEHHLIHTGHVGGEDNLPDHINGGFGHWFKTAGTLHAPGVDAIWRQIFPGADNGDFPIFVASAVNQRPPSADAGPFSRATITETNGVYGFGLTFEQMRWVTDYQYQRGVNLYAPMDYGYSCEDGRLYRTLSHLGPGNPLWRNYDEFAGYVGRLSSVLRAGDLCSNVAIYYPIEDCWAGDAQTLADTWDRLRNVTEALAKHQVTYEYIDAAGICNATVDESALVTPGHAYFTVIVPGSRILPLEVLQRLARLNESGGRVVFAGRTPEVCADFGKQAEFDKVMGELHERAITMDYQEEISRLGGEDLTAFAAPQRLWDGFSAAMGVSPQPNRFAADVLDPSALLVAPTDEIGRLARLVSVTGSQYRLQTTEPQPYLRMNAFALSDDVAAHFLTNEGPEQIPVELAVIGETPLRFEVWDCETGDIFSVFDHRDVSEETPFSGALSPFESILLVSRPLPEGKEGAETADEDDSEPEELSLIVYDSCSDLSVVSAIRIENGEAVEAPADSVALPKGEVELTSWDDWGLGDFSGSIAYRFALPLAEEYADEDLLLRLGECRYAAEVFINGEHEATFPWGPYELDVSGALKVGHNELVVIVTNTLGNQALREDVIAEAKAKGWFNTYYERAIPMMQETTTSGLMGPVELVAMIAD